MSHPIASNMEYIHHHKEKGGYEEDDEDSLVEEENPSRWHAILRRMSINIQRDEGTPDHEIISGTSADHPTDHERTLMLNIPHYGSSSEDFPNLGDETVEDNTLPTVEEIITEYIDCSNDTLHNKTSNYFENPFESDTASTDDTLFVQPQEEEKKYVHPLMTAATAEATPEKKLHHHHIHHHHHHSPDHHGILATDPDLMQTDSAQGTKKLKIGMTQNYLIFHIYAKKKWI
jgi:hypothetical protein